MSHPGVCRKGNIMRDLLKFDVAADDSSILVEIESVESDQGIARAARRSDSLIKDSGRKFDEVVDVVRPTAEVLLAKVRSLSSAPSETSVEFGLKLTLNAGAVIASSGAEGHFKITLTWKQT